VAMGDLQTGKGDGGGTPALVARYLDRIDRAAAELVRLRKCGLPIGSVYFPALGDCVESVRGHYAMQMFGVDLSLTEQIRVYRRMRLYGIKRLAPLAKSLICPEIPGNHDEAVRENGKAATSFSDSWAIDIASTLEDVLAENPDTYSHVKFVIPEKDKLTITLSMGGTVVAMAHGHQFRPNPIVWWANQAHGRQNAGDATLLLGAHKHHLHMQQDGDKTFIQVPAMDGGSIWWENVKGTKPSPGLVTFVTGSERWDHLRIH
jgi:hypothetical protein